MVLTQELGQQCRTVVIVDNGGNNRITKDGNKSFSGCKVVMSKYIDQLISRGDQMSYF